MDYDRVPEESPVPNDLCIPLPEATSLRRRYTVRRVTGFDACSITYDGFDYSAHQPISIIEFFPQRLAMRAQSVGTVSPVNRDAGAQFFLGSEAFLNQYQALTHAIGSPNIISVFDAFFENGTAYAVTERACGVTLAEYLCMQKRPLTPGELAYAAVALSDALLIVHSLNILHHAIAPERILLCSDGTVKLTNFCAAHETIRLACDVTQREPFTDIRALGQALYCAFTGAPAPANASAVNPGLMPTLRAMFEGMLAENPALRFTTVFDLRYAASNLDIVPVRPDVTAASIEQFRRYSHAKQTAVPLQTDSKPAQTRAGCGKRPRRIKEARGLLLGICALLAGLTALLILFLWKRHG